jgi:putative membrane protein
MSHRMRRALPLAAGAVVLAVAGAGGLASASDSHSHAGQHYSSWDEQWLMTAIEGDRFEVQGGELAQSKGTTADIRALGARLAKDHAASLADAAKLARRLGIDVPKAPSHSQQWELRTVAGFAGATFDRSYADLEVADHKQDIQEANAETADGSNRLVRHMAHDEVSTLKQHLKLSQAALQAAGG